MKIYKSRWQIYDSDCKLWTLSKFSSQTVKFFFSIEHTVKFIKLNNSSVRGELDDDIFKLNCVAEIGACKIFYSNANSNHHLSHSGNVGIKWQKKYDE